MVETLRPPRVGGGKALSMFQRDRLYQSFRPAKRWKPAAGADAESQDLHLGAAGEGPAAGPRQMAVEIFQMRVFGILHAVGRENDGGRQPAATQRFGDIVHEGENVGAALSPPAATLDQERRAGDQL